MRVDGIFTTMNFKLSQTRSAPDIQTAMPTGVSTMEKIYSGQVVGHSATLFATAFDPSSGRGAYVAMESFEGTLNGRHGTFNFMHSAATTGKDRTDEFFSIVAGSGTGSLTDIRGTGGMKIDEDGTHRIWFEIDGVG